MNHLEIENHTRPEKNRKRTESKLASGLEVEEAWNLEKLRAFPYRTMYYW